MTNLVTLVVATNALINANINNWVTNCNWVTNEISYSVSHVGEVRLQEGGRLRKITETKDIASSIERSDNSIGCKTCSKNDGLILTVYSYTPSHIGCAPYVPPTEKTETTRIYQIKKLKFLWDGTEYEVQSQKLLDEKVRKWKKFEDWKEQL